MIRFAAVLCLFFSEALGGFCDNKKSGVQDILRASQSRPGLLASSSSASASKQNLRNNLPTDGLIRSQGYEAETHWVTTEDGYILAIHRIPHGKDDKGKENRPVVFLQHGLMCSSADWVVADPSKGLGFLLADAGYDVWMGNYRGNTYSRNHTFFDPDHQTEGFWDHTWDEMAKHDLPSMIEKVLEVTGATDLQYVGHSMGTTAFMAMHHYRKDIGEKIRLAHLLSPVAYVGHMESPIGWIAGFGDALNTILHLLGIGEFLPNTLLIDCLASLFCHEGLTQGICTNILFVLCGYDEPQMNKTLLPDILHHTPAGAATTTILHYAQEVISNEFTGYDWGSKEANFHHHGPNGVPTYDLGDVTTPLAVYWGQNDWLAASEDVLKTVAQLPNIVHGMLHMVEFEKWNHLDFLWAIDVDKYVYEDVLANMEKCQAQDCRNL
jgi:lysosomal acid lipase/cholesteryl ester hydrolase